jgi:hypothetical protein
LLAWFQSLGEDDEEYSRGAGAENTYLRQSSLRQIPARPKLPNFVKNLRQSSQCFQQHRQQTRALGATGCSHGYAEAFLWFAGSGEDGRFEREEVEGVGEIELLGEEGGYPLVGFGEVWAQRVHEEVYFEEGDLVGEVWVGDLGEGEEEG